MLAARPALSAYLPTLIAFAACAAPFAGLARADGPPWRASVLALPSAAAVAGDSAGDAEGDSAAGWPKRP